MTRKKLTKTEREARNEARKENLRSATETLASAVAELQSSEGWADALRAMGDYSRAALGRLSFRNRLLIERQRPGTTDVRTYAGWQALGRQVKKGVKAVRILAPVTVKITETVKQPGGTESEEERAFTKYRAEPRFTAQDTERLAGPGGRDLPEYPNPCADIDAPEVFADSVERLSAVALELPEVTRVTLRARGSRDNARAEGWCYTDTGEIVTITGETSQAQQFHVLVHEIAHALLHGKDDHHGRPEREIEAESVAYVVCHALGLATDGFAVPYLASWGGKDGQELILDSADRISTAAQRILAALTDEPAALAA